MYFNFELYNSSHRLLIVRRTQRLALTSSSRVKEQNIKLLLEIKTIQ